MAYCRAIQTGEGFKSYCAGNFSGAVHSTFRRAVNLRMEDALVCIATPDVGGAYHCLNVAEKDLSFFVPGQPVRFSSEGVTVGGTYISLQDVPVYRSELSPSLRGTASGPMILRFKQIMDRKAPQAGVHTGREPELLRLLHTTELAAAATYPCGRRYSAGVFGDLCAHGRRRKTVFGASQCGFKKPPPHGRYQRADAS